MSRAVVIVLLLVGAHVRRERPAPPAGTIPSVLVGGPCFVVERHLEILVHQQALHGAVHGPERNVDRRAALDVVADVKLVRVAEDCSNQLLLDLICTLARVLVPPVVVRYKREPRRVSIKLILGELLGLGWGDGGVEDGR